MNTNATAQMVTSGGKGCMKQRLDIDQIAAEAARNWMYGKDTTLALQAAFRAAIEKATKGVATFQWKSGFETGVKCMKDQSHAAHASGQDESKAKRTARAIRSIAERAGLKITDDVELAWRDAILYALPAAHASKPRIPEQSSDNMSPAAHANTCPECGTAWPRHKGLCGGQPPPIPTVATAE